MKVSLLIRRTHMYLALFFMPWMAMYSLSTLWFNQGIQRFSSGPANTYEKETELVYSRSFPEQTPPRTMSDQILADLNLSGTHFVNRRPDGTLIINRQDPVSPRRIRWTPSDGKLLIERQVLSFPTWLRTIHHRTGYSHPEGMEDAWAFSVDLAILAMIFWVGSGIWMWWELRATRRWGMVCMVGGMGLFTLLILIN